MDRRSWLWRRKSSDKSPGETESSGSISSHSERFSDEQGYPMQNAQSAEVTSKSAVLDEEIGENENSLSAALRNIRAKEELVKQHAKVAEEAVSGWEKAENEVSALKKQLEEATQKNESLVTRVGYLDGALKECVRQLRQAKEEQEAKITEAIAKKSLNWESSKSKLERENSTLKSELQARFEELEMMAMDRDLSIRSAESASKQHLESINRVRKLEAECLRLKAAARKSLTPSVGFESFSDSQSDFGERNESVKSEVGSFKTLGKSRVVASSAGFNLMDDFLEMEKIAAGTDKSVAIENEGSVESELQAVKSELQAMINRSTELEEDIRRRETEKAELMVALRRCRFQLDASEIRLREAEEKLKEVNERLITKTTELEKEMDKKKAEKSELSTALRHSREKLRLVTFEKEKNEAENAELSTSLRRCQEQLSKSLTRLKEAEEKLRAANASVEATESQTREMDLEMKELLNKVKSLEEDMERDRALLDRRTEKCRVLEDEISKMKKEAELPRAVELHRTKLKQDQELAVAASRFAECQKTIASLGHKLKSLASLEDFLVESDKMSESERPEHHRNEVEAKPKPDIGGFYVQKRTGVVDQSSTQAKNMESQHGSRRFPSRAKDRRVN